MGEHICFGTTFASRAPFKKVLALGWYDGATSGLAQCSQCSDVFKYDIVAWDSDQERRMFAFSPIAPQEFDHIVSLLSRAEEPKWPFWCPRWQFTPVEKERLKTDIDERLARANRPAYIVASDRQLETVFATKRLSGLARDRLPAVFDGFPVRDDYPYWKEYVGLRD